jgi:hypothetical protein
VVSVGSVVVVITGSGCSSSHFLFASSVLNLNKALLHSQNHPGYRHSNTRYHQLSHLNQTNKNCQKSIEAHLSSKHDIQISVSVLGKMRKELD